MLDEAATTSLLMPTISVSFQMQDCSYLIYNPSKIVAAYECVFELGDATAKADIFNLVP